jgi:hypothetical protein
MFCRKGTDLCAVENAVECLLRHGVLAGRDKQLVGSYGSKKVIDIVEYIEPQLQGNGRNTIDNPVGLIIVS